ncbi:hypothetical protein E7T09_18680 [Deinococcus sp. KSM4-11]|uniref:hypothetical protein n=1 Tax=Deinococcus sp. KSM4-11 TaxID=2568654 RepID=UPI0010A2FCCE|nr:hypothetical protein [Deinococcus sp. KSM4-11]THF85064.1 hypothetical protein E7T09_18680 [Deinococcus sp. KSM4-11]
MKRALLTALLFTATVPTQTGLAQSDPKPAASQPDSTAPTAVKQNVKYTATQKLVKITTVNGKRTETLVDSPLTVVRGDLLVENVTVQNIGTQTLPQVTVSMPMPDGTSFTGVATAATSRIALLYSTDGGRNYTATPQHVSSVTENGKTVLKKTAAPMTEVTNVRWIIRALVKGESLNLSYRVSVD